MKTASTALQNFFLGIISGLGGNFAMADLYTITLVNGDTFYYTSWDQLIPFGGHNFLPLDPVNNGPGIKRTKVTSKIGLEVSSITVEIIAPPTVQVSNATPILQAMQMGLFDGATVSVDRLIMPTISNSGANSIDTSLGTYNLFKGTVADIQRLTRIGATFTVRGVTEQLNLYFPKNLYTPACRHTLYDAGCTLNPLSFTDVNAVASGSTAKTIKSTLTRPGPISPPAAPSLSYSTPSSGVNLIAVTYYVVITYLDGLGESTYSAESSLSVPANSLLHVASPAPSTGATGWNVYVGTAPGGEKRQNTSAIAIGINWIEPAAGLYSGAAPPALPTGGYFTQGVVKFTSGPNIGVSRYVDQYFGDGSFNLAVSLPFAPVTGDIFSIRAGCDKQLQTCIIKFNNKANFGGQPFVPPPEMAL